MKTILLVSIIVSAAIMFIAFQNNPAFASCAVNEDWPDAPCMDLIAGGRYPQDQVDRWISYYDYKGAQFMESKKVQMDNAIKEDRLMDWVNESIQNHNVWQYYHFSGQAPSPYPQKVGFDIIHRNGDSQENMMTPYNPVWNTYFYWVLALIVVGIIVSVFVIWRKRK